MKNADRLASALDVLRRVKAVIDREGLGSDEAESEAIVRDLDAVLRPVVSRVEINTEFYARAYGHNPRAGRLGIGQWIFCKVDPRRDDYLEHLAVQWNGSWLEARRQAIAWAKANGVSVLWVCS